MRALISSWSWIAAPVSPNWLSMASLALRSDSWPSCSGKRPKLDVGIGSSGFAVAVAVAAAAEDDAAAMDAEMLIPAAASAAAAAVASEASWLAWASWAALLPWNPAGKPVPVCVPSAGAAKPRGRGQNGVQP